MASTTVGNSPDGISFLQRFVRPSLRPAGIGSRARSSISSKTETAATIVDARTPAETGFVVKAAGRGDAPIRAAEVDQDVTFLASRQRPSWRRTRAANRHISPSGCRRGEMESRRTESPRESCPTRKGEGAPICVCSLPFIGLFFGVGSCHRERMRGPRGKKLAVQVFAAPDRCRMTSCTALSLAFDPFGRPTVWMVGNQARTRLSGPSRDLQCTRPGDHAWRASGYSRGPFFSPSRECRTQADRPEAASMGRAAKPRRSQRPVATEEISTLRTLGTPQAVWR